MLKFCGLQNPVTNKDAISRGVIDVWWSIVNLRRWLNDSGVWLSCAGFVSQFGRSWYMHFWQFLTQMNRLCTGFKVLQWLVRRWYCRKTAVKRTCSLRWHDIRGMRAGCSSMILIADLVKFGCWPLEYPTRTKTFSTVIENSRLNDNWEPLGRPWIGAGKIHVDCRSDIAFGECPQSVDGNGLKNSVWLGTR